MKALIAFFALAASALAGSFAPAAGQVGSTAISYDSPLFTGWATGVSHLVRGPVDITDPMGPLAGYGSPADVLGVSDAVTDNFPVLSLGDGGSITLTFAHPIMDGAGADFAVFENGLNNFFLELAYVEVSSNGANFHRFQSYSETPTATQVGSFSLLDPTNIHNLAGKYRSGFGAPFDLAELNGMPGLNLAAVTHIRIIDVVGSINPTYASRDSLNRVINDPWHTRFNEGGFDLDAIGVIHQAVPEPGTSLCLLAGIAALCRRRKRE